MGDSITVEVVYAEPARQEIVELILPAGATVADALASSGLDARFPDLRVDPSAVGIFGRKVDPAHVLKAGDRVEIYRPLLADPKEVRRARAEAAKEQADTKR